MNIIRLLILALHKFNKLEGKWFINDVVLDEHKEYVKSL